MPGLRKRRGLLWKVLIESAHDADLSGDTVKAERYYRASVTLARHARGLVHEDVGESLINLADFLASQEQYAEAEEQYRQALEIYERVFGRDNLVSAMIYRVLAELCISQARTGEAKALHARSTQILGPRRAG